jgi:hypothetical protein
MVPCQVGVLNLLQPDADLFPAGLGLGGVRDDRSRVTTVEHVIPAAG